MKKPKISFLGLSITLFGIITCFSGFILESNGIQNIHLLYCIILFILMFIIFYVSYDERNIERIKKENKNIIKSKIRKSVILYQISFMIQILISCYFSAWGRVTLLIISLFCLTMFDEKMKQFKKEIEEEENNQNSQSTNVEASQN